MTICIIGLGYIGLPTAALMAKHGHRFFGRGEYEGKFNWIRKEHGIEVVYLPRTPNVSTTALLAAMKS